MRIETLQDVICSFIKENEITSEKNPDFEEEVVKPLKQYYENIKEWRT